jgi:hypothetical protein
MPISNICKAAESTLRDGCFDARLFSSRQHVSAVLILLFPGLSPLALIPFLTPGWQALQRRALYTKQRLNVHWTHIDALGSISTSPTHVECTTI